MKVNSTDFALLKDNLSHLNLDFRKIQESYQAKGLNNTRFLWDMFWEIPNGYMKNYNDKHITTALNKAINELIEVEQ